MARHTAAKVAGSCLLLAALMMAALPKAHAGAVFEIREQVAGLKDADYKFVFDQAAPVDKALGSIVRSTGTGAGATFKTSAIPLTVFTLNKCSAVSPHIHPNAAEELFVLQGRIRITQFRGEEDMNAVHVVEVGEGEAGYIQQGSVHLVENIAHGTTKFLQIFDHPQAGTVFVAPALVALPRNVVNSAFSYPVLRDGVTGLSPLIRVNGCGDYNNNHDNNQQYDQQYKRVLKSNDYQTSDYASTKYDSSKQYDNKQHHETHHYDNTKYGSSYKQQPGCDKKNVGGHGIRAEDGFVLTGPQFFTCLPGYQPEYGSQAKATCHASGKWTINIDCKPAKYIQHHGKGYSSKEAYTA